MVYGVSGAWFIISPDAICILSQSGVSVPCRAVALRTAIELEQVIFKLLYSNTLHDVTVSISTQVYRPYGGLADMSSAV